MWSPIINELIKNQRFVISSHLNPDCDALGSELALAYHLQHLGKNVAILNTDPIPRGYQFLDPEHLIETFSEEEHIDIILQTDVIIVVDASGGWERLGRVGKQLSKIKAVTICIDHHPDHETFTDWSYVNPNVVATGELIFDLITAMKGELTYTIARSLYTAIITDSGNFRFPKTSAQTHLITAKLLETGVNPTEIYQLLYEQYTLSKFKLKGYILQHIKLAANNQIAYIGLTTEILKHFNVSSADLDGFSSLAQQIGGIKISIFMVEASDNSVKISLRSDGSIAVNNLAALFGGGGHVPAAGATTQGNLEEIMEKMLKAAKKLL